MRLTAGTDGSASPDSLLPTPSAQESTPTDEFLEEYAAHLDEDDPLHRLYLPGRKWMTQRTLSRTIPALAREVDEEDLMPTPGAWLGRRPENSLPDPERAASRRHEGTRGKRSTELPDALAEAGVRLLPTPTTQDGENCAGPSQRERNSDPLNVVAADAADGKLLPTPTAGDAKASGSRNLEGSRAHPGVSLTDAIQTGDSMTPRLLPTPQKADGDGGRQEKGAMGRGGRRPSGAKANLPLATAVSMREELTETPFAEPTEEQPRLLPTPVANPENPGAGGELRAALTLGEGRRNETGTDSRGRPNRGRTKLLPTPMESDADKASRGQRFGTGGPALSSAVNEEVRLLPTPTAEDGERGRNGSGTDRLGAKTFEEEPQLLPTPRVTSERNSRKAMVENQQWSSVSLAQAAELSQGILPREFETWEEVPGSLGASTRPPSGDGSDDSDGQLPLRPTTEDD